MLSAADLIARLQMDLTRKVCSFTEYVTNSSPYIAPGQEPMWEVLVRQAREDRALALDIGRLIVAMGGVPDPGVFDALAADTNYLAIGYQYRELLRRKEAELGMTEERVRNCDGHPAARDLMLRVLEAEQRQMAELREVREHCAPKPAPPAVAPEATAPEAAPAPDKTTD